MKVSFFVSVLPSVLALVSGCTTLVDSAQRATHTLRGEIYHTADKVQEYVSYQDNNIRHAPQTAYCYQFLGDIVCYDSPKPYMTNKLFGYQDYTAPAVPATQHYAPRNASVIGSAPPLEPVIASPTEQSAPVDNIVATSADGAMVQANDAEPEKATKEPKGLMPRF